MRILIALHCNFHRGIQHANALCICARVHACLIVRQRVCVRVIFFSPRSVIHADISLLRLLSFIYFLQLIKLTSEMIIDIYESSNPPDSFISFDIFRL